MPKYPLKAGTREKDEGARGNTEKISRSSKRVRTQVAAMTLIGEKPGALSSDDIAREVGLTILYVRPRISELKALGIIETAGRCKSEYSDLSVNRWEFTPRAYQMIDDRLIVDGLEATMLAVLRCFELEYEMKLAKLTTDMAKAVADNRPGVRA